MKPKLLLYATCALGLLLGLPSTTPATDLSVPLVMGADLNASPLTVTFQDETSVYSLTSAFVMPGEVMRITAEPVSSSLQATADGGALSAIQNGVWSWQAPLVPGHHAVIISNDNRGEEVTLQIFVMTPYAGERVFNGYQMGRYESKPKDGNPAYEMPQGLVEVNQEDVDLRVSPHFTLGDFLCKQESDWPKYVVLRTRLLHKLEMLQAEASRYVGREVDFHIMSAYRTPHYNRWIGNNTTYSRHLYGDAADVYVDMNEDEWMDDLNGDGKRDTRDAGVLFRVAGHLHTLPGMESYVGGLGIYSGNRERGPFIHVDTRGEEKFWSGPSAARNWLRVYEALQSRADRVTEEE